MLNFFYPKFWQRRGVINYLLLPLSLIFFLLAHIRKLFVKQIKFSAKVICVGNISVGGTGKTQVVILLSKFLQQSRIKFLIITKGYKSNLKGAKMVGMQDHFSLVGDESVLLRNYGYVIATKKPRFAKTLVEKLKPEVIILDDGMQSPAIYKDITILCIDNIRMFGNGFLLPAGPLRENMYEGIKKSDLAIIIGNKQNDTTFKTILDSVDYNLPIFNAIITPEDGLLNKNKDYFVFCGIGDPERFLTTIKMCSLNIIGYKFFSDHHNYSTDDLKYLNEQKTLYNAELITTEKDYVKLKDKLLITCFKSNLIIDKQSEFTKLLYEKLF